MKARERGLLERLQREIEADELEKQENRQQEISVSTRRTRKNELRTYAHEGVPVVCMRCRRRIVEGDPTRLETFYDDVGAFETRTHRLACSEYRDRPRLEASETTVTITSRGRTRVATMTDKTTTTEEEQNEAPKTKRTRKSRKGRSKSTKSTKTKKTSKKGSRKSKTKSEGDEPGRSANVSCSEALLAVEGFDTKGVKSIINDLAADKAPSNEDMVKLRDHVKAEASRLRENDDSKSAASELSSANRLVRRIERSTRD